MILKLRNNWLNILSAMLIVTSCLLWLLDLSLADEATADGTGDGVSVSTEEEEKEYTLCAEAIRPMLLEEEGIIVEYVQEAFLQEKWNSEIVEEANGVVDEAFERIHTEENRILSEEIKPLGYTYEDLSDEALNCGIFIDMHERTLRNLILAHSTKTSSAKASYVLVRKLQDINEGLREMNRGFGDIYAGFKELSDKLPGVTS